MKEESKRRGSVRGSAARREKKINTKPKGGIIAICIIGAIVLCASIFGIISACSFSADANVCADGVTIGGVDVGGKTKDEVIAYLSTLEDPYAQLSITMNAEDKSASKILKAQDIDLVYDMHKTADEAVAFGKGNIFAMLGSKEVGYSFTYNMLKLETFLNGFAKEAGGTLVQHEIDVRDKEVVVRAGKKGLGVDVKALREKVLAAIKAAKSEIISVAKVNTSPAQITGAELYELTKREPQDARYAVKDGTVVVEAELDGREIDVNSANSLLSGFGPGSADVTIPFIIHEAQLKADSLSMALFADELGSFSTKYQTSNVPRSANVELAAKLVNNTILLPGDEFSYNVVVGPRTSERGFRAASVYENNKMVDGLGGGICQTSSTLYGAVLKADLEVVERHEHSLEVSYAPLGMDATVAYGSLDFRFKNNTDAPLKVVTSWGGGTVKVRLLGTKANKNRTVEIKTVTISTTPYGLTEIPDDTLAPGQKVVDAPGFKGHIVDTYKIIREDGKEIENKFLHRSKYTMVNRVERVSTKAAEETDAPLDTVPGEPTASPEPPASAKPTGTPTTETTPAPTTKPTSAPEMPDGL